MSHLKRKSAFCTCEQQRRISDSINAVWSFFVMVYPYVDTHQKEFIFDHLVPCSVGFDSSTTSDIRVLAPGWGLRVKI